MPRGHAGALLAAAIGLAMSCTSPAQPAPPVRSLDEVAEGYVRVALENIDDFIHVTDTAAGAMISVKMGTEFVEVVLLQGQYGNTASGFASDNMMII